MTALSIILDIVLILISLVLIAAVLMQQGQRQGLGAIAGGAETFFGKNKSRGLDGKLQKITKIAAVVFIVLAIVTTIVVAHNASSSAAVTDVNAAVQEILNDVAESETAETETAAEARSLLTQSLPMQSPLPTRRPRPIPPQTDAVQPDCPSGQIERETECAVSLLLLSAAQSACITCKRKIERVCSAEGFLT